MALPADGAPLSWRTTVAAPGTGTDTTPMQHEQFLCSNDPALIQLDALQEVRASDLLWWAQPLEPHVLRALVANSVCVGVYRLGGDAGDSMPAAGSDAQPHAAPPPMVGFARLITDRVTIAYLTDVYVLPAYQGRGLGKWMMRCVREMLVGDGTGAQGGWPTLRGVLLLCKQDAAHMYEAALGAENVGPYRVTPENPEGKLVLMELPGPSGMAFRTETAVTAEQTQ